MSEITETVISETRQVSCDGNTDIDGHPRVFLTIGESNSVSCPYCSRLFKLQTKR